MVIKKNDVKTEEILGIEKCPLCGGKVEVASVFDEDKQKIMFHAECKDDACGCNSGWYDSIRYMQDRWNSRVGSGAVKNNQITTSKLRPSDIEEDVDAEYIDVNTKALKFSDTVDKQGEDRRWYKKFEVVCDNGDKYEAYYDGHGFKAPDTSKVIENVEKYRLLKGSIVITKEQADHNKMESENE